MNIVGKILVLFIFAMSLLFAGLAVAVFSAHKNWMEIVTNPRDKAMANQPLGLVFQLEDAKARSQQLTEQVTKLQESAAAEKVALEDRLAKAESKRDELQKAVQAKTDELTKLTEEAAQTLARLNTAQTTLDEKLKQIDTLRADVTATQGQRDQNFKDFVLSQEKLNQATIDLETAKSASQRLVDQMAKAKIVLERHDLSPDTPVDGVPPKVDGIVLASTNGLLEISLGSDDGLHQGNTLEVYRRDKYLGRIEVLQTAPDKSVGKVIPGYLKGKIERDDRVTTRFN